MPFIRKMFTLYVFITLYLMFFYRIWCSTGEKDNAGKCGNTVGIVQ